jgi:hypothetical protein
LLDDEDEQPPLGDGAGAAKHGHSDVHDTQAARVAEGTRSGVGGVGQDGTEAAAEATAAAAPPTSRRRRKVQLDEAFA